MATMAAAPAYIWVDLEMTGLDPERDHVVEIATLVSDAELELVAEGPSLVIHQPDEVLALMSPEVQAMHARSGLTERIRASRVSLAEAEAATTAFLRAHFPTERAPLCGNSVWKDRQFLERHMPQVAACLHYRTVDVSSLKELVRRWYPERYHAPKKRETHRALDDIHESLAELRHYRAKVFVPAPRAD
jgi:oligoribonuclease